MARGGWFATGAVIVVELSAKEAFEPPAGFTPIDERRYATTRIVFLGWAGVEQVRTPIDRTTKDTKDTK